MKVLDTPIDVDASAEEFDRRVQRELEHDTALDDVAARIADVAVTAIRTDRAVKFWEVGDVLLPYQLRVRKHPKDLEPYEALQRTLRRLEALVEERLRDLPGKSKESYGVAYFLKHIRVRERFRRDQMDRGIPYPYYHELVQDYLSDQEREDFLQRIGRGEFSSAAKLRVAVRELGLKRGRRGRSRATPDQQPDVQV